MEVTDYTDGVVWVTNQRVVLVDTTYWLDDIVRAEVVKAGSRHHLWIQLVACLCLLPLVLLIEAQVLLQGNAGLPFCGNTFVGVLGACLALYCGRIVLRLISGPHDHLYLLRLHTRRGRVDAYCSLDRAYLVSVVDFIASAFSAYRPQGTWTLLPHR